MELINEMGRNYLIVDDMTDIEMEYAREMLINNEIRGIPRCRAGRYNNSSVLKDDVTNRTSIRQENEKKLMSKDDVIRLFGEIIGITRTAFLYLLDERYFVLKPEFMYRDMESGELRLIYIPFIDMGDELLKVAGRYYALADMLLAQIDHKDSDAVEIAYGFYSKSKEELFSLDAYYESINGIMKINQSSEVRRQSLSEIPGDIRLNDGLDEINDSGLRILREATVRTVTREEKKTKNREKNKKDNKKGSKKSVKGLFKRKTGAKDEIRFDPRVTVDDYWYDDGETVFMDTDKNEDDEKTVFIEENRTDYVIAFNVCGVSKECPLNYFPQTVGKKYEAVDICISDNSVSRTHAEFIMRDNEIYIRDLGSTNGTYVDDVKIGVGEEKKVCRGTKIRFGKVETVVV